MNWAEMERKSVFQITHTRTRILNQNIDSQKLRSDSMVTHKIELHCNSSSSTLHGHLVEVASGTTHEISCSHTQ